LRRIRLETRFILYFTALIVVVLTPIVLLVERRMEDVISRQAEQRALSIARNLAALSLNDLVASNDVALARNAERAKRNEEGIADVIILDRGGRVAAYAGDGERPGTTMTDRLSVLAATVQTELIVPVELPRSQARAPGVRALDVSVPVYVENGGAKQGTVRVRLRIEDMHRRIRDTRRTLLGIGLLAVVIGAVGSFLMARRITRPLSNLVSGTIRAAGGDLETRIAIHTGDEIEELAGNFNEMVAQVQANQKAIEELNRSLEEKVRERTQDLSRANEALMKAYAGLQHAETHMILTEKMASLGQLVAGIAHEINTPSSAIAAAIVNTTGYLEALTEQIPAVMSAGIPPEMEKRFYDLVGRVLTVDLRNNRASTAEVRQRSRALEGVLAERGIRNARETAITFSRLGLHAEIGGLVETDGAAETAGPCLDFLDTLGNLGLAVNDVRLSTDAITRMVKALRGYSHPEQTEMAEADIHDGLETTLTILRSQIKYGVVVERRYSRLPSLICNVNELNQVWTNLIHNAIQAMQGVGKITIETYQREGHVGIRITDSGPGIPEAIRGRIFDPFFTTKDQGEGTGLGLGIAHQIVQRHGGRIEVASEPGRTSFEVLLPLLPSAVEARK
jgi:signal transduction histidine kinase